MDINARIEGDIVILAPNMPLMMAPETDALFEKVGALAQEGYTKVVLDLKDVHMLSSIGIGIILRCNKHMQDAGGAVCLTRLSERIHHILVDITQISISLPIFDTVEAALAGLNEAS